MYIVVVGCSKAGYHLTKMLLASGHEVVVIDKSPERCQLLSDETGIVTIQGDGTDEPTLRRAGISRADIVVAVAGRDDTNLVICQMAKEKFQVPRTMALIKDPKNEPIFHILEVDVVVNAIHQILASFEEGVPGRPLVHLMDLRVQGMELVSVSIPDDAAILGKRLGQVELPPNCFICLVVKRSGPELPIDSTIMELDDELMVVTRTGQEQILYDILTGVQ
jgi:trk system potassium uptake protein TrkA